MSQHTKQEWISESALIIEIIEELRRAERKFPFWPSDKIHASAIVGEESG